MTTAEIESLLERSTDDLGDFAEDFTKLKWRYEEHWSGEMARFDAAGYSLFVRDCDGDSSWWNLKHHGKVIAEGESWGLVPNHFFVCLREAEQALRDAVTKHRLALLHQASDKGMIDAK